MKILEIAIELGDSMGTHYKKKYNRQTRRLQKWDYGWNGKYFVTICTKNKQHFFGEIKSKKMFLNDIGNIANSFWLEITSHFKFVQLGKFVVMPNHIHGIVEIKKDRDWYFENPPPKIDPNDTRTIGQRRFQNQGSATLSSIIGSYKSIVSRTARKINPKFAWQYRFDDRIIRDDRAYNNISKYIEFNPRNWKDDRFFDSE